MCNKYYKLRKSSSHFSTRAFQKVFREAIWNIEKDILCKPKAYILAVTKKYAQSIIPETKVLNQNNISKWHVM